MAKLCPCGCGRKVSFIATETAKRYAELETNLSQLRNLEAELRSEHRDTATLTRLLPSGESIRVEMLDYLHKTASPSRNTPLTTLAYQLRDWNTAWQRALAEIVYTESQTVNDEPDSTDDFLRRLPEWTAAWQARIANADPDDREGVEPDTTEKLVIALAVVYEDDEPVDDDIPDLDHLAVVLSEMTGVDLDETVDWIVEEVIRGRDSEPE